MVQTFLKLSVNATNTASYTVLCGVNPRCYFMWRRTLLFTLKH